MTRIENLRARQVWDSRGRPTIEVEVRLSGGAGGRAIAPSGASTGSREAFDRRDGGKRLGGYGVNAALADLKGIVRNALRGHDAEDQHKIDDILIALDGTPQKTRLGGNAIVATSCAVAWAAAAAKGEPLWRHLRHIAGLAPEGGIIPSPMIQVFGGGRHAGGRIDIQDFLVICPKARSFAEATEWIAEVTLAAKALMKQKGHLNGVADEGGIWPDFARNEDGLEVLTEAIGKAGFRAGDEVGIALDVAASSFVDGDHYRLALEHRTLTTTQLVDMLEGWCRQFPILSLEDPVGENDDDGFVQVMHRLGPRIQVIGDDYLVSSAERVAHAGGLHACNAVLLKANQCGTITELIAASNAAQKLGWNTVQSGRSGESEDVTLSHLAVGLGSQQIKVGAMQRSERAAKWNEVLRIEEGFAPHSLWRFAPPSP